MTSNNAETDWLRLRQVCLVASALEPAVSDLGAILGLRVCHRDPNVATFGVENALFVAGTTFIEIIAPLRSGTAAGRFLERSDGVGGYIAIFDCKDPDLRKTHAASIGVPTAFEIDRPGVYRCVQLHPKACRAAMLEFDRTAGGDALEGTYWPAGGDGWQEHVDTSVTCGISGIGVVGPDPTGLASHWGSILQRPVVDGSSVAVDGSIVRFAKGNSERERLDAVYLDAANPARILSEAEARGRRTAEAQFTVAGMVFHVE